MIASLLLCGAGLSGAGGFQASDLRCGDQVVRTTCGSPNKNFILEVNGGGLITSDFNLDGHLDLVVVDGSTLARVRDGQPSLPARVLLGDGHGAFTDGGPRWALAGGTWGMGGCAGDVDGDGDPDLFVTEWGVNRLYLNDAGRGFVACPVSAADPAEGSPKPTGLRGKHWSTSAAFLDYDADGLLDLVVINYLVFRPEKAQGPGAGCSWKGLDVMCGPEGLLPVHDQLFQGHGDGTFTDVSLSSGFRPPGPSFGMGVMTLDYDNDGDADIYVSNDSMPNYLWENQGDGTFKEVGLRRGVSHDANGKEQAGMGIACADLNGDGREDLFVTNFSGERNALYQSSRAHGFRERADAAQLGGASISQLGWGTGMGDFDLDGWMDLFVINGHVYPQADSPGTDTTYAQGDQLFLGNAEGRFELQPLTSGAPGVGRAALSADFDEDGDLDLVVIQMDGPVRYLRNDCETGSGRHWAFLELHGTASHPDAIGARVRLIALGKEYTGEVRSSAGFQAGCSTWLHFGLGAARRIDEIHVLWPSGHEQVLRELPVDRHIVVQEAGE